MYLYILNQRCPRYDLHNHKADNDRKLVRGRSKEQRKEVRKEDRNKQTNKRKVTGRSPPD
jgi:hypothetical protein